MGNNTNPFLKSPFDDLLKDISAIPERAAEEERQPSGLIGKASLLPPDAFKPLFIAAAKKYDVPVSDIMALAQQESGYDPDAIGSPTEYGRAKGMLQYLDSTASQQGINQFSPEQSIDAAARQYSERIKQGYTPDEAIMAHFGGDDRKQWGKKTAAYGRQVREKANEIQQLLGAEPMPDTVAHEPTQELKDKVQQFQQDVSALTGPQAKPTEPEAADNFSDFAKLLGLGATGAARSIVELTDLMPGVGLAAPEMKQVEKLALGKSLQETMKSTEEETVKSLTPQMQEALQKKWWDSETDSFGPAFKDWRSYAGGIVQSVPEQVITMIPAVRLAKAAYATKIAAGAAPEVAAKAAAQTATIAGGIAEGLLGGAQSGRSVRDDINALPDDVLLKSEAVQSMMKEGKTLPEARAQLAEDQSSQAFLTSGIITGMFGGMGDRAMAKIITEAGGGAVKRALTGLAKGTVGEGLFEELPQSAGQQLAENIAMQPADKRELTQDVINQMVGGAVLGGVQGGAMGTIGGLAGGRGEPAAAPAPGEAPPVAPGEVPPAAAPQEPIPQPEPTGPLSRSVIKTEAQISEAMAAEPPPQQPKQVTVTTPAGQTITGFLDEYQEDDQGNYAARVLGTDGQTYQFTSQDGVTIQPVTMPEEAVKEQQKGTKEAAIKPVEPEKEPQIDMETGEILEPEPAARITEEKAPAPVQYDQMDEPELRQRLKYITQQAKQAGWNKGLLGERKKVEKAINALTEAKAAPEKPAAIEPAPVEEVKAKAPEQKAPEQAAPVAGGAMEDMLAAFDMEVSAEQPQQKAPEPEPLPAPEPAPAAVPEAPVKAPEAAPAEIADPTKNKDGSQKWFGSKPKASEFLAKKDITGTHEVKKVGNRWEIHAKGEEVAAPVAKEQKVPTVKEITGKPAQRDPQVAKFLKTRLEDIKRYYKIPDDVDMQQTLERGLSSLNDARYRKAYNIQDALNVLQKDVSDVEAWIRDNPKEWQELNEDRPYPLSPTKTVEELNAVTGKVPREVKPKPPQIAAEKPAEKQPAKKEAPVPALTEKEKEGIRPYVTGVDELTRVLGAIARKKPVNFRQSPNGTYDMTLNGEVIASSEDRPQSMDPLIASLGNVLRSEMRKEGRKFPENPEEMTRDEFAIAYEFGKIIEEFEITLDMIDSGLLTEAMGGGFVVNVDKLYDMVQKQKSTRETQKEQPKVTKKAQKQAKKGETPKQTRAKQLMGADVGDVITLENKVAYAAGGTPYKIDQIEKSGTVYLINTETGGQTSLSLSDLQRTKFEKQQKSTKEAQKEQQIEAEQPTVKDEDRFAENKIFTADKVAAARARLKSKVGQLNVGLDPEMLVDGMTIAGAYIESGMRNFKDYTKAMVDDFGDGIKPFLLSFWEGARSYPGLDTEGMTSVDESKAQHNELMAEQEEIPDDTQPGKTDLEQGAPGVRAETVREDEGGRPAEPVSGQPAERGGRKPGRGKAAGAERQPTGRIAGELAAPEQPVPVGRGSSSAERSRADSRPDSSAGNYRIAPGELTRKGSWKETAERNVQIIELVKQLDKEGRYATDEEKALLVQYTGMGASEIANGIFPDQYGNYKQGWAEIGNRLKSALTKDQYEQASRTTQYAHYTSEGVIRSIYDGIARLGFNGGLMMEPGMGTGHFSGLLPDSMAVDNQYTGIEYDYITSRIGHHLYPQANVINGDYTKTPLPRDYFDIAIGNPPFSATKVLNDPEYKKQGFMLHDYFFAKTIDRVKPGGLMVLVTSKGTMDKASSKLREYVAYRANLVGAVRLPQTAFKANAGTEVVTDVLFLQKHGPGITQDDKSWMALDEVKTPQGPALINTYFVKNPEMVLGKHALTGSMYRKDEYTVEPLEGVSIEDAFAKALMNLPENIYRPERGSAAERAVVRDRDFNPKHRKEGGLYVADDGTLMQVNDGSGIKITQRAGSGGKMLDLKPKEIEFLKAYTGLRDALKQAQYDQLNDGFWQESLKTLGDTYDAFVKEHGNLLAYSTIERTDAEGNTTTTKRFKNDPLLRLDAEGALAYALEKLKEDGTIVKGEVLNKRVLKRDEAPQIVTTQDAMFVSLNQLGHLDIDDVARLAGTDKETAIAELGTAIYDAPGKGWIPADEYLSGNVVRKLKEAQAAAVSNPKYQRNVEALLAAQPRPLGTQEISVRLGANWIPTSDIEAFAKEVIGERMKVKYSHTTGQWDVEQYGDNKTEYGFTNMTAGNILESTLNNRQIKITWKDSEGRTHVDTEATEKANDIAKKMRVQFSSWVWRDTKRSERLVNHYNDNFNNIVPRKFDGSHLTLPGVSALFKLYGHQKRGIWRTIQEGDSYYAHAVGAGKTFTMIAAGMEQKRLGLINKPMYVVPNHMLAQFSREFLELYPAANIMVADEHNFHSDNRRRFVAQAALNNPDAIVITHSGFGRIGMSDEYYAEFISEEIAKWKEALQDVSDDDRITRKRIEKKIEGMERKLEGKQGKEKKDVVLNFEELGVDYLFVDEAHEFRKLDFATNQGNVKGIDPNGSQRAQDLFMKVKYLRGKKPGRAITMASGTPVTNTMGELFTVQRFFQPEQMEEDGTDSFDAWASMYGDITAGFEQNAAGGYEIVSRFAKFSNVPELMSRIRSFMDILTSSNLGDLVKRPTVEGGGRDVVVTPVPEGYKEYQKVLESRINTIRSRKGRVQKGDDIILNVIADGRFSAIDMRFVDNALPSDPTSKLNQMLTDVIDAYNETKGHEYTDVITGKKDAKKGSSLMVFTDIGLGEQSAANRGFDMKAWITKRLTDAGIPREEIAFMRDYKEHAKKERLFSDMRSGNKRILIGGKEMETGTNVQKRLSHLFHLDAPWFPASVEQREGRIVRQGNQNPNVVVKAYATKGSYDSTMWGMNARKAKFIEQAMNGDASVRNLDDVSEASAFETAAALASGDERYMKLAGLRSDVERLNRLRNAHYDDQNSLMRDKHRSEQIISRADDYIAELKDAISKRQPIKAGEFSAKVGKETFDARDQFSTSLFDTFRELAESFTEGEKKVGEIGGFDITYTGTELKGSKQFVASLDLGIPGDPDALIMFPISPDVAINGIATRAANQVNGLDRQLNDTIDKKEQSERRVTQINSRLGAPFPEEAELLEKVAEVQELEDELTKEQMQENDLTVNGEAAVATLEVDPDPDIGMGEPVVGEAGPGNLHRLNASRHKASPAAADDLQKASDNVNTKAGVDQFVDAAENAEKSASRGRKNNPQKVLAALREAEQSGEYNTEGMKLAQWLIRRYQHLADTLDVTLEKGSDSDPYGSYNVANRMITLFSEYRGVDGDINSPDMLTAVHEIMHHAERMMPADVQAKIAEMWLDGLRERLNHYNSTGQEDKANLLSDFVAGMYGDKAAGERGVQAILDGTLPYSDYQFANPSEYWAENASRIIADRKNESWVKKAIDALRAIFDKIKSLLGIDTPVTLDKALDSVLKGDGKFKSDKILAQVGDELFRLSETFGSKFEAPEKLTSLKRSTAKEPMVAAATESIEQEQAKDRDQLGKIIADQSMASRLFVHPRTIASVHPEFTPVYRTAISQMESRDANIAELGEHIKKYNTLPQNSKDTINKVLELGRLLERNYSEDELKKGIVTPPERKVASVDEEGRPVVNTIPVKPLLSKAGETIKLSDAEAKAYSDLRVMFDIALDKFRDQVLEEYGFPELVGKDDASREIIKMITKDTPPEREESLMNMARFVSEIEQAKRTGYVPFARYGDYVVTVKETIADLKFLGDSKDTYIVKGVTEELAPEVIALGGEFDEKEDGWRIPKSARQDLKRLAEKTIYSEKVETGLVGKWYERRGKTVEDVPEVKRAIERVRKEWVADNPDRRLVAFKTETRKPEQPVSLTDVDALASVASIDNATWDAIRDKLADAIKGQGFRRHFFHSENVPGYTGDFERAMSDYIIGMSGYLSRREHIKQWDAAISNIKDKGKLHEYSTTYRNYVNDPQEEFAFLRQIGFLSYIAGVPATAFANLTQVPFLTIPTLGQIAPVPLVIKEVARAYKDALAMFRPHRTGLEMFDPAKAPEDMQEIMKKAWAEGVFVPLESYDLMMTARQRNVGRRRATRAFTKSTQGLSYLFTFAERLNRLVTYMAAARLANKNAVKQNAHRVLSKDALAKKSVLGRNWSPENLAEWAVDESQFRMGKANRPTVMRGVGAAIMQFKSFMLQTFEAWYRMVKLHDKRGAMMMASSLAALVLMAGVWGLPGADDLRKLLERIYKRITDEDIDLKSELRGWIMRTSGSQVISQIVNKGITYPTGVDLTRVGMGTVAPDSTLGALGIPADLIFGRSGRAIEKAATGDYLSAAGELSPNVIKNVITSLGWSEKGVRDKYGKVILPPDQLSTPDLVMKSLGFNPATVTDIRDYEYAQRRQETAQDQLKRKFTTDLARSIANIERSKTPEDRAEHEEKLRETLGKIKEHNEEATDPSEVIKISPRTVRGRVAQELEGVKSTWGKERKQARGAAQEMRHRYGLEDESDNETE